VTALGHEPTWLTWILVKIILCCIRNYVQLRCFTFDWIDLDTSTHLHCTSYCAGSNSAFGEKCRAHAAECHRYIRRAIFWQSPPSRGHSPQHWCLPPKFIPRCPAHPQAPLPCNLGYSPKQTVKEAMQSKLGGGTAVEAGQENENWGRVLARPILLITWAESWSKLQNKTFPGAKHFGDLGCSG